MPGGDRTGPRGQGPLTGRGAGYWAGGAGRDFGRGAGRGFGRGAGRGFGQAPGVGCWERGFGRTLGGRGRGFRNGFCATGVPFSSAEEDTAATLPATEEIALLRSEAERLRSVLESIETRLAQLETT